jgi:hypothetical protein
MLCTNLSRLDGNVVVLCLFKWILGMANHCALRDGILLAVGDHFAITPRAKNRKSVCGVNQNAHQ